MAAQERGGLYPLGKKELGMVSAIEVKFLVSSRERTRASVPLEHYGL
jgi:hypothetical protein